MKVSSNESALMVIAIFILLALLTFSSCTVERNCRTNLEKNFSGYGGSFQKTKMIPR
jgi:hypothetical protein